MTSISIAGRQLPIALQDQIGRGSWPPSVSLDLLSAVFGEDPDLSAKLYSIDEMEGETSRWQHETDPAYLGSGDDILDPARSIIIGDLGYDRPIGIDLRNGGSCVRLLAIDGRWRLVSESIERLIEVLKADGDPV